MHQEEDSRIFSWHVPSPSRSVREPSAGHEASPGRPPLGPWLPPADRTGPSGPVRLAPVCPERDRRVHGERGLCAVAEVW
jgi:hypothetical protein